MMVMTVWKNPCLQCGCGVSVYWPNCPCLCHKGDKTNVIQWNNTEEQTPAPVNGNSPPSESPAKEKP